MTIIIAEAGTNHAHEDEHERFCRAQKLISAAAAAGADAVKFQLFVPDEELFCPLDGDENRWPRWRTTFLRLDIWRRLKRFADDANIDLFFSAFQKTGVEWSRDLGSKYYKVASRAADRYPYDLAPGPFLIADGMNRIDANTFVWSHIIARRLKCVSKYPAPLSESRWNYEFAGLSDHSGTVWPGLEAIFGGAEFLEVHFRTQDVDSGPDSPVCLHLDQLKLLCDARDAFAQMKGAA